MKVATARRAFLSPFSSVTIFLCLNFVLNESIPPESLENHLEEGVRIQRICPQTLANEFSCLNADESVQRAALIGQHYRGVTFVY